MYDDWSDAKIKEFGEYMKRCDTCKHNKVCTLGEIKAKWIAGIDQNKCYEPRQSGGKTARILKRG